VGIYLSTGFFVSLLIFFCSLVLEEGVFAMYEMYISLMLAHSFSIVGAIMAFCSLLFFLSVCRSVAVSRRLKNKRRERRYVVRTRLLVVRTRKSFARPEAIV